MKGAARCRRSPRWSDPLAEAVKPPDDADAENVTVDPPNPEVSVTVNVTGVALDTLTVWLVGLNVADPRGRHRGRRNLRESAESIECGGFPVAVSCPGVEPLRLGGDVKAQSKTRSTAVTVNGIVTVLPPPVSVMLTAPEERRRRRG